MTHVAASNHTNVNLAACFPGVLSSSARSAAPESSQDPSKTRDVSGRGLLNPGAPVHPYRVLGVHGPGCQLPVPPPRRATRLL